MARMVALMLLASCSLGTPIQEQTITVACGMCIFQIQPPKGCYWAARVDDGYLPITGPGVPAHHEAHQPGGMCTMEREAVVTGTRYADKIIADRFELVPVENPAAGAVHDHRH